MRSFLCLPDNGMTVLSSVRGGKPQRLGEAIDTICELHHNIVITIFLANKLLHTLKCTHRMGNISCRSVVTVGSHGNDSQIFLLRRCGIPRKTREQRQSAHKKMIHAA